MREETMENIRRSWKIQTFQYDYLSHIKGRFVLLYLILFGIAIFAIWLHQCMCILLVPCMLSWIYFIFFDRKRRVYKDSYRPQKYELLGTLFYTVIFSVFLCYMCYMSFR